MENNAIIEGCGEQARECESVEMMYQTKLTNFMTTSSSVRKFSSPYNSQDCRDLRLRKFLELVEFPKDHNI